MSPRDNQPQTEICGLTRLAAYKIRQLELLDQSEGPDGAEVIHQISTSLLRERVYAESISISASPSVHEQAMRSYYSLLEDILSRGLEKEKKNLAEQILVHNWKNL